MSKSWDRIYKRNLRASIRARNRVECGICHEPIRDEEDLTLDHILPKARGGGDTLQNLQPAHKLCNWQKGHRFQHEVERPQAV